MAKRSHSFELEANHSVVLEAARDAIRKLHWDLDTDADHLVATEDPVRLCCTIAPVTTEVHLSEMTSSRTRVRLDGSVPGWGPIASRQLASRLFAFERTVRKSLVEPNWQEEPIEAQAVQ